MTVVAVEGEVHRGWGTPAVTCSTACHCFRLPSAAPLQGGRETKPGTALAAEGSSSSVQRY